MIAFLLLIGCPAGDLVTYATCDLTATFEPASADRGGEIVATGGPFTEAYDTLVQVGGVRASVTDVTRDACDACDTCRDEQVCTACEACAACAESCATCVQTVTFVVPDGAPSGPTAIVITNGFGASPALSFEVTGEPVDTGPADTGADTGADSGIDEASITHPLPPAEAAPGAPLPSGWPALLRSWLIPGPL